ELLHAPPVAALPPFDERAHSSTLVPAGRRHCRTDACEHGKGMPGCPQNVTRRSRDLAGEAESALAVKPLQIHDPVEGDRVATVLRLEHDRAVLPRHDGAHDLAALEADLDPDLVLVRAHRATSSESTPWAASGCTKATCRPKRPGRGVSSINSAPRSARSRRAAGRSATS